MTGRYHVERLVVVHGGEDELLAATLALAGLEAVYLAPDLTVWAPTRWGFETNHYPFSPSPGAGCDDVTNNAELFLAYLSHGDTP